MAQSQIWQIMTTQISINKGKGEPLELAPLSSLISETNWDIEKKGTRTKQRTSQVLYLRKVRPPPLSYSCSLPSLATISQSFCHANVISLFLYTIFSPIFTEICTGQLTIWFHVQFVLLPCLFGSCKMRGIGILVLLHFPLQIWVLAFVDLLLAVRSDFTSCLSDQQLH